MKKKRLRWGLLVCLFTAMLYWSPVHIPNKSVVMAAETETVTESSEGSEETASEATAAFDRQDITELYKQNKFTLSGEQELTAVYTKKADGYVFTGSTDALAGTVFTFTEEFDFSDGVVGRVDMDALAAKSNTLKVCFYLDNSDEPFAELDMRKQKREGKWYSKSQTVSVYDQKITGKHKVSFRIVQSDSKKKASFVLRYVTFAKSTLPVAYFNIDESQGTIEAMNSDSEHDTECYGSVTMEIPDGYESEYGGTVETETLQLEYIRGRGNSTWQTGKNPYKIKFEKKQNLFNMGKNKHWVLLADYYDPSHLRNKATYWLGEQLGMEFTPQCVYIDVVMNGEYYGSYLLAEQVRVGETRVNIDDLEEDETTQNATDEATISGGYLLSLFPYGSETEKSFTTSRNIDFLIESPSFEDYENETQYNYIKNYVQKTEDAIYAKDFTADGKSYSDYMDVDSAVDYYWVQEFSMNGDAFGSTSTYLYKKRDGKLFFGPLWDFDYVAWGNNEYEGYSVSDWMQKDAMWFSRLFKNSEFADKIIARWPAIKAQIEALCKDGGKLDEYAAQIKDSMKYNSYLYGTNYETDYREYSFEDSVSQLKNWMQKREEWVDENVNELKVTYKKVVFKNGGKTISEQQVAQGDYAEFPSLTAPAGYVFGGWYEVADGTSYRVDSSEAIYEDMVLTAKWVKKADVKPVTKIILGYDKLYTSIYSDFYEDDSYITIPYTYIGGENVSVEFKWSSSDEEIAKVTGDGTLQLLKEGETVVTASTSDGKVKASCKVIVLQDEYNWGYDFSLNKETIHLKKGDRKVLNATPNPEDSMNLKVNYTCASDCVELETVGNKCVVRGVTQGTAQIIAIASIDDEAVAHSCTVTVGKKAKKTMKPGTKVTRGNLSYEITSITKSGGTVKVTGASKSGLENLKIPSSIKIQKKKYRVTAIDAKAFYKNKTLRRVTIGNYVTKIGSQAFAGCKKLKKVTFGKRVRTIREKAFYKCRKLNILVFKNKKAPTIRKQAFAKIAGKIRVKTVKKANAGKYKNRLKKAGAKKVVFPKSKASKKTKKSSN